VLEEQQTGKEAQDPLVRPAAGLAETGVVYRAVQSRSMSECVTSLQSQQLFSYRLNFDNQGVGPGRAVCAHWESRGLKDFPSKHNLFLLFGSMGGRG